VEQNPILTNQQEAQKRTSLTKPQLWLLGGALLIGIMFERFTDQGSIVLYSAFWLVVLAVFVAFNWKRVITNKTVLALILPTLLLCVLNMLDYMDSDIVGFTSLAIPALLLTIGVFTTQEITYKREGKAALGVLRAVFVKPFTAIGTYFRAYAGVLGRKKDASTRHGWAMVSRHQCLGMVLAHHCSIRH